MEFEAAPPIGSAALADGILLVTLERGICFGDCPSYRVTLHRDGTLEWFGDAFVDRLGAHRARFWQGNFENLATFLIRCGFFAWDEDYPPLSTCSPSYELSVTTLDGTKTVCQEANPEPPDFWVIAALVDHIADRATWE